MTKKNIFNLLVLIVIIALGFLRISLKKDHLKKSQFILDTVVEINISGKDLSGKNLIDSTFTLMKKYENKFTYYSPDSELSIINESEKHSIDKDFYKILDYSQKIYDKSSGMYDIAIGQLVDIWKISEKKIPSQIQITSAKEKSGFDKIKFSNFAITKPKSCKLVLGSIAKGYIVDKAVEFLKSKGVESGIINAGGDLRIFGVNKPQTIGIRHPRKTQEVIEKLNVKNKAVVTSGDYERFFIKDGKRYHHILNPKTGKPTENTFSVTVLAPNAMQADALSTACFAMAPEKAIEMINSIPGTDAIIYYKDKDEIISIKTKGIKGYLKNELSK